MRQPRVGRAATLNRKHMANTFILLGCLGYLFGSIPFGWILMRTFRREDIRAKGSGNIGATNVLRSGGKWLGLLTFLLDAVKGYVAVSVAYSAARHLGFDLAIAQNLIALAALCAILGHIFPLWLGFRGGKGVATAFGVFLAISPVAALIAVAVFAAAVWLSRYVSLSSILAAIVFPIAALLLRREPLTPFLIAVIIAVPAILIAKHHGNIRRLLKGTEYRFGKPKASAT